MRLSPPDLDALVVRLRAAGCVFAEDEAALLGAEATDDAALAAMTARRVLGEPLEQVVGWSEFCGLRIAVAPGVFVPRRRTELLVRSALRHLADGSVVVDLGCGTGAVAAALRAARPGLSAYAVDIDPDAVAVARRNLPGGRVMEGDLYAALPPELRGEVAVVVANAPYVPSDDVALMPREARDHEHRVALDGGPDGLDVQRRVIREAPAWLRPDGRVLVETGRSQVDRTCAAMRAAGLVPGVVTDDDIGATVVAGSRPPHRMGMEKVDTPALESPGLGFRPGRRRLPSP